MERLQNIPKELISRTINLDYRTPMSKAGHYLNKYSAIVITKNKEYYGIVDTRTRYRALQGLKLPANEKVEKFSIKTPKITNSTSIYDLVNYFYKLGVKALPFSAGSRIIGIFERSTLLKVLLSLNILENMKVGEAMTTPVLAIDANASVAQAKSTMRERKVNRLVVLRNDKFVGLITNYDMANEIAKGSERLPQLKTDVYKPSNISISSVMEPNVRSIEYNRPLSDAVRDMIENSISSLVVVKNSNPIGILTVTDVMENILVKQRVAPSKVFMSGFDANTYQYEDDAREELRSFVDSIERLSGIDVDYITFKVKRSKSKLYELQVRLSLGRHGIISMHVTKYLFDDALSDLIKKLKHRIIKEKESIITHKKVNTLKDTME
ncbi:MAG: CBS domain-containing protein [Candidatus Micrarchaeota archaeon]|nr:CBS domain-containing protein [Candidatus Micrarchaeota archaeon]